MKRYITGFNGLRTVGVLAVILYHIWPNTIRGGFLGVVLFFVLSGYLVTDSLLREYEAHQSINLWNFWKRRLKRLYPLLITIFLVVTPYLLIFQRNLWQGLRSEFLSSVFSVQNWWQISQGSSYFANISGASPFKHIYYLAIEGQFFLIWPLLLFILIKFVKGRGKNFIITSIIALISAILMMILFTPGTDPTRVYYGTDTRLFSLMMGASLAFVWPLNKLAKKINKRGEKLGLQLTVGISLLLLISYFFMPAESAITYYGGMWFISLLTMILIALVAHPALPANKIFSNVVFDYIGSRSYGIYLWQLPVFVLAEAKLLEPLAWYNIIWQLALILGLAELSYRFVEVPAKNFNYGNILANIQSFIKNKGWKEAKNILPITLSAVVIVILGFILFSPASPHDQKIIEEKIMAQQEALQKKELAAANNKVALPLKTIASKYQIEPVVAEKASKMKILAVGDSVMVAGSTNMQEVFPNMLIDATVGRQASSVLDELNKMKSKVPHPDALLIGLGTNGVIKEADVADVIKYAAGKPVYWINVHADRVWESPDNKLLSQMAKKYSNLKIIDWNKTSEGKTAWFYSDGIHPKGEGAIKYAALIANSIAAIVK